MSKRMTRVLPSHLDLPYLPFTWRVLSTRFVNLARGETPPQAGFLDADPLLVSHASLPPAAGAPIERGFWGHLPTDCVRLVCCARRSRRLDLW